MAEVVADLDAPAGIEGVLVELSPSDDAAVVFRQDRPGGIAVPPPESFVHQDPAAARLVPDAAVGRVDLEPGDQRPDLPPHAGRVQAGQVVGEVGQGFATAMRILDLGRLSLVIDRALDHLGHLT